MINSRFLLTFLFILMYGIVISQEWKLEKDKNGITVYSRDVADSEFAETKASSNFNTTKESFLAFIWDIENYPNWQKDYKTAKVLTDNSASNKNIYFEFKAPWPISNRDVVINMKQTTKDNIIYVNTKIEKSILATKEDIIRMSKYDGFWKIEELEEGIRVTLQMSTNPEGKIPAFLIDFYKASGPFNAFTNMQNIFE